MVTPVAFASIGYKVSSAFGNLPSLTNPLKTYVVFAVINAFMVPCVYFFFPETAYRSLEEMDEIFQDVHGIRGAFDVVKVAREKPHRFGKRGELLIGYDETDTSRRRSSVASGLARRPGEKTYGHGDENGTSDRIEDAREK